MLPGEDPLPPPPVLRVLPEITKEKGKRANKGARTSEPSSKALPDGHPMPLLRGHQFW